MRDHGGDLDRARRTFGDGDWIDLSTGINAVAYPVPELPAGAWTRLPDTGDIAELEALAQQNYATSLPCAVLGGAQAAIQLVPRLQAGKRAAILGPTYNEHAGALVGQGWQVTEVETLDDLSGADIAVVVNPNNPDGTIHPPEMLLDLSRHVGLLVVDESFADTVPEVSILPHLSTEPVLVLRSFGKFYGLAGLRLGFALGQAETVQSIKSFAGPWAINGPAIRVAQEALTDEQWKARTRTRLASDAKRMDGFAERARWRLIGGTDLFRTFATPDARQAQAQLAKAHIWTRIFPYSQHWIRLGLPGGEDEWARLEKALAP